jgi:hypothetical protein
METSRHIAPEDTDKKALENWVFLFLRGLDPQNRGDQNPALLIAIEANQGQTSERIYTPYAKYGNGFRRQRRYSIAPKPCAYQLEGEKS